MRPRYLSKVPNKFKTSIAFIYFSVILNLSIMIFIYCLIATGSEIL